MVEHQPYRTSRGEPGVLGWLAPDSRQGLHACLAAVPRGTTLAGEYSVKDTCRTIDLSQLVMAVQNGLLTRRCDCESVKASNCKIPAL